MCFILFFYFYLLLTVSQKKCLGEWTLWHCCISRKLVAICTHDKRLWMWIMDIHGYIHGYGYGWQISYSRQAWKECWKSVNICQRYGQLQSWTFFETQCTPYTNVYTIKLARRASSTSCYMLAGRASSMFARSCKQGIKVQTNSKKMNKW